jgi:hypothetical protein
MNTKVRASIVVIVVAVASVGFAWARLPDGLLDNDREAIIRVAHDYIDGFYEANGERMNRALHPNLAKRDVTRDSETGKDMVRNMTAQQLVEVTESGYGARVAEQEGRQSDVTILDVFENVASVKIVAITWIDYLHVGKVDGEWKIINVLWEWKPDQ